MSETSFADRLRYAFDNLMSKGTIAMIGWLALVTLVVTLAVSVIVWFARIAAEVSFVEQFWAYLMLSLDTDAMSGAPWPFRFAALVITFTGIFVTSILVGLLATGIANKIEDLRKGRSRVVETGHTVILGWSPQIFPIISELVVASANQPKARIVILGDRGKVEMEDEIHDKVGDTGHTRIVCRRGNPMEMGDLDIPSLRTAKSIIILAPEGDDPDSSVIKTMLAITNSPNRRPEPYHIVAEIHDPKNIEVARIVGQDEVELVLTGDLIARITAQTCRQSGLSVVYTELLDFAGDEIYFKTEPDLVGKTFGEALKLGWSCDENKFLWWEDPYMHAESAYPYRRLRQLVRTPLLQMEHVRGLEAHIDFIVAEGTDFVRGDVVYDGGITGVMKIAHAAEGFGLDIEIHHAGPAERHLAAAIRNCNFYEMCLVHPKAPFIGVQPYKCDYRDGLDAIDTNGCVPVPKGPGLGVEYDWDYIDEHTTSVVVYE